MATTSSSTGNFSSARYSEMIQKQLLEVTPNEYRFREATESGAMKGVSGHSNQLKINRNRRIAIPSAAAGEGTAPTPTTLEIDTTTGTASQYVMSVKFTDVMEIYAFHDVLSQAVGAVKDAMNRLDEKICGEAFESASNVLYPDSVAARSSLAAANVINTDVISKAVAALRRGSNIYGPAKPYEAGLYKGLIHDWATHDLRKDATFLAAESRAMKSELYEKGVIADWAGVRWLRTNWMPEYVRLALTDFTETSPVGGPTATNAGHYVVVRKDVLRMFSEAISVETTVGSFSANDQLSLGIPATAGYLYDLYYSATDSATPALKLHASGINLAPSATFVTGTAFGTGATAPVAPAASVTVLPTFVCGMGGVKAVDLRGLESFITPRVSTPDDPAIQNRTVSAKVFNGAFVQQNAWIRKIEACTSFAS